MGNESSHRLNIPEGVSLEEAYAAVRSWLQAELRKAPDERYPHDQDRRPVQRDYGPFWDGVREYIEALPDPETATEDQMLNCLLQIGAGRLEFACGGSDGRYLMFAYFLALESPIRVWQAAKYQAERDDA